MPDSNQAKNRDDVKVRKIKGRCLWRTY
jgi:hypothetical protein